MTLVALSLLELIAKKTALQTSFSAFNCMLSSFYSTSSFNFTFRIHTSNLKLQLQNLTSDLNFKCQPHTLDSESTSNVNFKSQHWTSAPNFKFKPQCQLQRSFSKSTLNFHSKIQQIQTSTSESNFEVEHQTSKSNIKLWQTFTSQCLEVNKDIIKYKGHGLLGFYT